MRNSRDWGGGIRCGVDGNGLDVVPGGVDGVQGSKGMSESPENFRPSSTVRPRVLRGHQGTE